MANYSLIINSKFKPFSFQELLQPALMATQAHQQLEDAYGELSSKASIWDKLTNPETDKNAHSIYSAYAKDLENQAEDLARYGLNPSSRQQMLNMRSRYARDIVPIETAYKKREAQVEEQRKARLSNPTLLLSRNAAETSLDKYLDNPELGYDMTTGALLQQQVATAASALAKAARNDPKVQTELRHLLGFNYETIRRKGFAPEEIQKAILGADDANPALLDIVNKTLDSSGIGKWNFASEDDRQRVMNRARAYANEGLWSAVGETQYGTVTDDRAKALFEHNLAEQRAANQRRQAALDSLELTPKYDRRNVQTTRDIEDLANRKSSWEQYKHYFDKDERNGTWKMNAAGKREYERNAAQSSPSALGATAGGFDSDFKKFVNGLGLQSMARGAYGPNMSKTLNSFVNTVNNVYDETKATEYYVPIHSSNYDNVMAALSRNASKENEFKNYERVKEGNSYKFKENSEKIKLNDIKTSDIQSANVVYGQHGNFLEVKLKGGEHIFVPYERVNANYNILTSGNIGEALTKRAMQGEGRPFTYMGMSLTPEQAINIDLNAAAQNMMSGLGTSTTEAQKFSRGLYLGTAR